MSLAWRDGAFVQKENVSISLSDVGFSRGLVVFELMRVYGGVPFRLKDHFDRFFSGAEAFGIACPLSRDALKELVLKILSENHYPHSVLKMYLTAGECKGGINFATTHGFTPHLIVAEDELAPVHPEAPKGIELYARGIALKSVPFSRQMPEVKTINSAPAFCAAQKWGKLGYDDILMTQGDNVTEVSAGNFFAVLNGKLCTPKDGMLPGITRRVLLELAENIGVPTDVRALSLSELAFASEAFITGSSTEILPVRKIDDFPIPVLPQGGVFRKLRDALSAYLKEYNDPLIKR